MIAQRVLSGLSALLLTTGIVQGVRGGWIHAKACLAQVLLQGSWERTREGGVEEKPWPWADTWPVARLTLPGGGEYIVLAGAAGRNLAFAPGHLDGSAEPGGLGTCVIAGHRDTHFSDLDKLEQGQTVVLEDNKGRSYGYRVVMTAVVGERDTWVVTDNDGPTLVLVTCWPLDSPMPGGTQRFVVWAEAEPLGRSLTAIRVDGYTAHTLDNADAGRVRLAVKPLSLSANLQDHCCGDRVVSSDRSVDIA